MYLRTLFIFFALFLPLSASAINVDADKQCTSGGVVGQPCKDSTSGYTTQGKCVHINVCQATSWPKSPREKICDGVVCRPGQVPGNDYGEKGPVIATDPVVNERSLDGVLEAFANEDQGIKDAVNREPTTDILESLTAISDVEQQSLESFLATYEYPEEGSALSEAPKELIEIARDARLEQAFVTMAVPPLAREAVRIGSENPFARKNLLQSSGFFDSTHTGFRNSNPKESFSVLDFLFDLFRKLINSLPGFFK